MSTIKAGTTTTTAFSVDQDTTGDLNFQAGSVTPLSIKSTGLVSVSNTASFKLPVGTIAQRPASPQNGMMRFNSDMNEVEVYSGGEWQLISSGNLKLKLDFDETTTLDSRISFTRATNGTYFDSAGVLQTAGSGVPRFDHRLENGSWVNKGLLIEEQRTNLFQRSEEFDNAYWVKSNVSLTTNNIVAPDGTTTAERVLETITNGVHTVVSTPLLVNMVSDNYTVSMFIKGGLGRTRCIMQFLSTPSTSNNFLAEYNFDTLTASTSVSGSAVVVSASIQNVGNGWYRIAVTGRTGVNANHQLSFYIANDSGAGSYAGDTSKGMYVWGAQLEAGSFPTSYIKTTDAAATRNADVASMTSTNFSSWYNATEGTVLWQGDYNSTNDAFFRIFYDISDNGGASNVERNCIFRQQNTANDLRYLIFDNSSIQVDITLVSSTSGVAKVVTTYKANDAAYSLNGSSPSTDTSLTIPTVAGMQLGGTYSGSSGAGGTTSMLNGHIAKFYYWNTRRPNQVLQNLTE
jgi:hypothetical protein